MRILLGSLALYDSEGELRQAISDSGGQGCVWMVDAVAPIRAGEVRNYDRGNAQSDETFTVCREHENAEEAFAFKLRHRNEVAAARGGLIALELSNDELVQTWYLAGGQLKGLPSPRTLGSRSWITYALTGGLWTQDVTDATASLA
jgi:hypothetical protein